MDLIAGKEDIMTPREYLGNDTIAKFQAMGYTTEQIKGYARQKYIKEFGREPSNEVQQASLTPQQNTAAAQPAAQNTQQGLQESEYANTEKIAYSPAAANAMLARIKSSTGNNQFSNPQQEEKQYDDAYRALYAGASSARKDEELRDKIALAQNTTIWQKLTGGEKDAVELQKDLDYIAKNAGYELGAVQTDDGKIYFRTTDAKGNPIAKELTPGILNDLAANKGEIIGGVTATALAPFTGGGSFLPLIGASATGTALGSMSDLYRKGEATGREYDAGDYAARALQSAGADALGGVAVAGAGKLIKAAVPTIKQAGERIISPVAKNAAKIADNNILVNLMRRGVTDNIEGAEAQYIKSMGGEAEALKNLAASKNALGEEGFKNFANAERSLQIPKTGNEAIDKSINYINEKGIKPAEQTIRRVIQGENLNEREANLLASALSNDKGADLITRSVAGDADAFAKTQKIMTNLNSSFAKNINESFKDAPNVVKVFKDYEARTKNDFGNVIKTLDNEFGTLGLDTRALSARVGEALENTLPKGSQITKYAMKGIQKGGLEGLQDARAFLNGEISTLKKANDALSRERLLELREARGIIDDAIDGTLDQFSRINPEVGVRAKELMQTARADYGAYKEIEQSDLFKRLMRGMKNTNDLTSALLKSADNQTGLNLDEVLSVLNPAERANVEGGLLKNIIERNTKEGVTDFKTALEQIDQIPFKSERVAGAIDQLKESAPILKNSGEILKKLSEMTPKTAELQQGIGKSITGAFQVMLRNRLVNKLKSKIPWYGNNQALKNHIVNALKNAGDLEGTIKNIEAIPTEGLDSATKDGLNKFVKEVIPEIRQILKTQEDDAVRAKFNPEELKKSLIDPNLTTQEKVNLVDMAKKQIKEELDEKAGKVAKGEPVKQGEGFTMKEGRTDYPDRAKFELGKYLKENLKLNDNPITASLNYLFNHHREMFTNRRAVYDLIKNVLDDMPEVIEKRADGGYYLARSLKHDKSNSKSKMADLVLDEQEAENYIKHANLRSYSPKMREVMDKKIIADSKDTPLLTHRSESARVLGDNVLSARPGSNELLSASHGSIIPQSSQKVKELPPADLRKAIINAKDDKERLAIIENQKVGIKQRLENEAAGDKTADKLAKEAQGLADNKPAEKKFTLETIKSFDPRKHGHAYLSKISFNDRKPVREFIDSNTRMWDSKRKYYETSYTFNAKEGDMFEARLDDGSWKSDTKEYYIVKKDDKGELYLSKIKELSDLRKEAIKEAETKSEWESKISNSTDAVKLNKIMRDIEHTEAITPNNRAKLYVAITNRLKELRKTER
jgi:putative uncharacterized protein (fragment)